MKTDREFSNLDTYRELDSLLTHGAEARPFLGVLVSPKMHLEKFRYTGAVRIHLFGVWLAYGVHVNLIFTEERIQRTAFPDALTRQSTEHLQNFTLMLREDRPRNLRSILAFTRSFLPAAEYALVGEFMVAFLLVFIASRTAVHFRFLYSSMACFAIRDTVEEYALLNALTAHVCCFQEDLGAEAVFCIDEWSTALGKTTVYVGVNIFALPNASVAQKCCRQRPVFIVLRTVVNSECPRPSCIVDPTVLRQCKSVPFVLLRL